MLYITLYENKNENDSILNSILRNAQISNPESFDYTFVKVNEGNSYGVRNTPWLRIRRGEDLILNENIGGDKGISTLCKMLDII